MILSAHYLVSRHDNQYIRQQIENRTLSATGFELKVSGPLELPYSLVPTVVLRDISLNNPDFPGQGDLLHASELRIEFAVLPLLRDEVVIYESSLSGVELSLQVDDEGDENWIARDSAGASSTLPSQIAINTVDSRDVTIRYDNRFTGASGSLYLREVSLRAPRFDDQIRVDIAAEYSDTLLTVSGSLGSAEAILSGNALPIDLEIDVLDVDLDVAGRLDRVDDGKFSDLELRLDVTGGDLAELEPVVGASLPTTTAFNGSGSLALTGDLLALSDLDATFERTQSRLDVSGRIADVEALSEVDLTVTVDGSDVREIGALFDVESLPQSDEYRISTTVNGDWPTLTLSGINMTAARHDTTVSAIGSIGDLSGLTGIEIDIAWNGEDLAAWSSVIDADVPSTDRFRFGGRVSGNWPALNLTAAQAILERKNNRLDLFGSVEDITTFDRLDLDLIASGDDLSAIPELEAFDIPASDGFAVEAKVAVAPDSWQADVEAGHATWGSHTIVIDGALRSLTDSIDVDLDVAVSGNDVSDLNHLLAFDLPPTIDYQVEMHLNGEPNALAANDVSLRGRFADSTLSLTGRVGRIVDFHDADLLVEATSQNLNDLRRYVEIDLPINDPVLLSGRLLGTAPDLRLEEFVAESGNNVIHGSFAMRQGPDLHIDGRITEGRIDLAKLIGAGNEAQPNETQGPDPLFTDQPLDLPPLDGFDGRLTLDDLVLLSDSGDVVVEQATVTLDNGALSLEPLRMIRDESLVTGSIRLVQSAIPQYEVTLTGERMNFARFLSDLGITEAYEGQFDITLDLRSRGVSLADIAGNLEGSVAAYVGEARVPQVSTVLNTVELLFELLPWVTRQEDVVVNCAINRINIEQGIAAVDLLYVDAAQLTMIGGGEINLRQELLDLRLMPRPKRTRFLAHNIDLLVRGSLTDPNVTTTGATRAAATAYGKYALVGPLGLLVPTGRTRTHACAGSLEEFRSLEEAPEVQ